jgi:hypothetical protein
MSDEKGAPFEQKFNDFIVQLYATHIRVMSRPLRRAPAHLRATVSSREQTLLANLY